MQYRSHFAVGSAVLCRDLGRGQSADAIVDYLDVQQCRHRSPDLSPSRHRSTESETGHLLILVRN
jgi:hypothetical protein